MSLTSYRAAPPRGECIKQNSGRWGAAGSCFIFDGEDLLWIVFCRPGGDLLSRVLRQSTIGAEAFDGRVRDGIGSGHFARATRPAKDNSNGTLSFTLQPRLREGRKRRSKIWFLDRVAPLSRNPLDCAVAVTQPFGLCAHPTLRVVWWTLINESDQA